MVADESEKSLTRSHWISSPKLMVTENGFTVPLGPLDVRVILLDFRSLLDPGVPGIRKGGIFLPMQKLMSTGQIGDVCCSADYRMHETRLRIRANMGLHPKVPRIALFGLVHLWVPLLLLVLSRAWRADDRGIDNRALAHK